MNLDDRKVVELNLNDILPNRFQPRIHFSEDAINELSESIKEHGVIQPIVVRKINDKYEIIAGERRYKASTMAGKTTIPAIVTDLNDKESAEIALIENVQREDLTPIEEAISYKKILNMGYLTQEDLSSKLGKKQSTISNKLRLLNLDETVQDALLEKKISERHARSLLKLENKDQKIMLDRIIKERLTVRKTDAEIEKILHSKEKADQIEILEVEDIDTNKGDKNMNNEVNNNYNIPTTPIIEDIPTTSGPIVEPNPFVNNQIIGSQPVREEPVLNEVTSQPSIFDIPQQNETINQVPDTVNIPDITPLNNIENVSENQNTIAPGFMDVDKIQNQATDINVEKPAVDLNTLLTPTPAPEEVKPQPVDTSIFGFTPTTESNPQVEKPVEAVKPGKFFDLDSFGEIEEVATPESIENLLNNSVEPPKVSEEPVPTQQPTPTENRSEMFGINLEPKNPDFVEHLDSKEANIDFGEPKPVIDNNNLNFDQFYKETPTSSVENQAVVNEPIVQPQPVVEEVTQPIAEQPQTSVFNTPAAEPVVPITPQPVNSPVYNVPTAEELDSFLTNLDSTTPLSQTPTEAETISDPIISTVPPTAEKKVDIDQVVAIVREAKDKITALGIKVDIDEFDFDDMYQAIIKIDK